MLGELLGHAQKFKRKNVLNRVDELLRHENDIIPDLEEGHSVCCLCMLVCVRWKREEMKGQGPASSSLILLSTVDSAGMVLLCCEWTQGAPVSIL